MIRRGSDVRPQPQPKKGRASLKDALPFLFISIPNDPNPYNSLPSCFSTPAPDFVYVLLPLRCFGPVDANEKQADQIVARVYFPTVAQLSQNKAVDGHRFKPLYHGLTDEWPCKINNRIDFEPNRSGFLFFPEPIPQRHSTFIDSRLTIISHYQPFSRPSQTVPNGSIQTPLPPVLVRQW